MQLTQIQAELKMARTAIRRAVNKCIMKQMKTDQIHQELANQFGVTVEDIKLRLSQLGININS